MGLQKVAEYEVNGFVGGTGVKIRGKGHFGSCGLLPKRRHNGPLKAEFGGCFPTWVVDEA